MRLLIDSDVLLDFIGERESTAAAWVKLHAMELAGAAELWVSAEAFGEVRAALAEALSDHDARSALRSAMAFLSVCSIDGPDVRFALEHEGLPYRAALTESCARKLQADFIVTTAARYPSPGPCAAWPPTSCSACLRRSRASSSTSSTSSGEP